MIVTMDGPAGSGKSTAAKNLAAALGVAHLDTGATYRAVTLAALSAQVDLADEAALSEIAATADIQFEFVEGGTRVLLNGSDVTSEIRSAAVSDNSHHIAVAAGVRKVLVALQRKMGLALAEQTGGVVAEGRDQGTAVFPDADVKIYLDASPEVRARRRADELRAAGSNADYDAVLAAIKTRDHRDSTREIDPLTTPEGAVVIDTTDLDIDQVTARLVRIVRERA